MAKRKDQFLPRPDTVWSTRGRSRVPNFIQSIQARTEDLRQQSRILQLREFDPDGAGACRDWWWGFDAAWRTDDGACIRARLQISPDKAETVQAKATKKSLSQPGAAPVGMGWLLTAEADQPWQEQWPSPLEMFFDLAKNSLKDSFFSMCDWASGQLTLTDSTLSSQDVPTRDTLAELTSYAPYITVLTHDWQHMDDIREESVPGVVKLLPPSLTGRVVETLLWGDQDQEVNAELGDLKVQVPWGGAVIVPNRPRPEGWPLTDCVIRRPPGGGIEQLQKEVAEAVVRYSRLPVHYERDVRAEIEDFHANWALPEVGPASTRLLVEKQRVEEDNERLNQVINGLRDELSAAQRHGQEMLRLKNAAETAATRLLEEAQASDARQAQEQAERAWAAYEAAEAEVERLTSEAAWLRRERAQSLGKSYSDPAPEPLPGPKSWDELLELAGGLLTKVRVGNIAKGVGLLRGHEKEKVWLQRSWSALESYQAYAEAKAEHGPVVLPHMRSYLQWQRATVIFPTTWHAPNDASALSRDPKYTAARTFTVPDLGPVVMAEHVRIDHGRPPAPRMHVYDDTCGPTGMVHIGYIGPHLPNGRDS
ncbi:hypothetical protein [Streptomyces sp. MH60]|uniref:hypothetical protein n=1 Tax=Streptomyces sp. MH60 TaxID=1940758 RepID=UPI000CEE18D5|nr:hypothetical protein [Streptomyces sp. MH60]PPS89437.1 hypothetical protein BZZ08_01583 [Streptomyces sp. MH60]